MADEQTIIIKRIKKGGHGAHGGAWKVAYADFVTAMMAFFLLLWLLSSASEEQKEGIAEYFSPTVGVKGEMGIGFDGGQSESEDGIKRHEQNAVMGIVYGAPSEGDFHSAAQEQNAFEEVEAALKEAFESDPELAEFKDHVIIEQTPEGLRVQVVDKDQVSMFAIGSAKLEPHAQKILSKISELVQTLPNNLSISGHTDAAQYSAGASYTNWELSSDRAQSSRKFLMDSNFPEHRVVRVAGHAEKELLEKDDPKSARNRRISLLMLKHSISPYERPEDNNPEAPKDQPAQTPGDEAPAQPITAAPLPLGGQAAPTQPIPGQPIALPEGAVPTQVEPQPPAIQFGVSDPKAQKPKQDIAPHDRPAPLDSLAPNVDKTDDTPATAPAVVTPEMLKESIEDPSLPNEQDSPDAPKEIKSLSDPSQFNVF